MNDSLSTTHLTKNDVAIAGPALSPHNEQRLFNKSGTHHFLDAQSQLSGRTRHSKDTTVSANHSTHLTHPTHSTHSTVTVSASTKPKNSTNGMSHSAMRRGEKQDFLDLKNPLSTENIDNMLGQYLNMPTHEQKALEQAVGSFLIENDPSMSHYIFKQLKQMFWKVLIISLLAAAGFGIYSLFTIGLFEITITTTIVCIFGANLSLAIILAGIAFYKKHKEDAKLKDGVRSLGLTLKTLGCSGDTVPVAGYADTIVSLSTYVGRARQAIDAYLQSRIDIQQLNADLSALRDNIKENADLLEKQSLTEQEIEIAHLKQVTGTVSLQCLLDSTINAIGCVAKLSLLQKSLLGFSYLSDSDQASALADMRLLGILLFVGLLGMTIYGIFKMYYYFSTAIKQYLTKQRIKRYLNDHSELSPACHVLGQHLIEHTHWARNSAWGIFRSLKLAGEFGALLSTLLSDGLWALPVSEVSMTFSFAGAFVSLPYTATRAWGDKLDYEQAEKLAKRIQMLVAIMTPVDNDNMESSSTVTRLQKQALLTFFEDLLGEKHYKQLLKGGSYQNTGDFYRDITQSVKNYMDDNSIDVNHHPLNRMWQVICTLAEYDTNNELQKKLAHHLAKKAIRIFLLTEIKKICDVNRLIDDAFVDPSDEDKRALAGFFGVKDEDRETFIHAMKKSSLAKKYHLATIKYAANPVIGQWMSRSATPSKYSEHDSWSRFCNDHRSQNPATQVMIPA